MLLSGLTNDTIYDRSLFIENGRKAGYFEWLNSKGTNYTCYQEYLKSLTPESIVDKKIEFTRVIIYTLQKPFTFMYFYWTMLVFVIHRFNFKKPIMRLILYHFILRYIYIKIYIKIYIYIFFFIFFFFYIIYIIIYK